MIELGHFRSGKWMAYADFRCGLAASFFESA
jgi:hypothetical protein